MHLLYEAASIQRKKMKNVYISYYYPANDEVSLNMLEAMMPPCLISFVYFLTTLLKHFLQYQWIFRMKFEKNVLLSQSACCQIVITKLLHLVLILQHSCSMSSNQSL